MCVNLAAAEWSYTCAERGEQIPYCFSFFGCGELYFMGDEKQINFTLGTLLFYLCYH